MELKPEQRNKLDMFTDGQWYYDPLANSVCAGYPDDMISLVADIRGHGFLTGGGHGALGLPYEKACDIQDIIGRRIAKVPDMLKVLHDISTRYNLPCGDKGKIKDILSECKYGNFNSKE